MAISAVVIVAAARSAPSRAASGRRARRLPRLTADSPRVAGAARESPTGAPTGRRSVGISFDLDPGASCSSSDRRAGKSTLALAIAGLIPREIPATMTGSLELDGHDRALERARRGRAGRARPPGPVGAARHGAGRGRRRVRTGEPRLAAGGDAGARPGGPRHGRAWPASSGRRSRRLSGGQQQRLALAGARSPAGLLVLDEPTANLDPDGVAAYGPRCACALSGPRPSSSSSTRSTWPGRSPTWSSPSTATGRPSMSVTPARLARSADRMRDGRDLVAGEVSSRLARASRRPPTRARCPRPSPANVRFGYDRSGEPVVRDVTLDASAGERWRSSAPTAAGSRRSGGCSSACSARPWHVALRGRPTIADASRDACSPCGPYVFQEPERQFLTQTVAAEVRLGLTEEELDRVDA